MKRPTTTLFFASPLHVSCHHPFNLHLDPQYRVALVRWRVRPLARLSGVMVVPLACLTCLVDVLFSGDVSPQGQTEEDAVGDSLVGTSVGGLLALFDHMDNLSSFLSPDPFLLLYLCYRC